MNVAPTTAEIADAWRSTASLAEDWRRVSCQAGSLPDVIEGEGGGFFVTCDSISPRRAYMKPRALGHHRAAREKIASDLAYEVGLCVPPVVLTRRRDAGAEQEWVACSLVMYPMQYSWEEIVRLLRRRTTSPTTSNLEAALRRSAAIAWCFDTWVHQNDHQGNNGHNIIFGYEPDTLEEGEFVFLDYAFSCGALHRWNDGAASNVEIARVPDELATAADGTAIDAALAKIESVEDRTIEMIVDRITVPYLDSEARDLVAGGLKARRPLVRKAFEEAKKL